MSGQREYFETLGSFLGYPSCCVAQFCNPDARQNSGDGPWIGTGFLACVSCAQQIRRRGDFMGWVADNITPNRHPEAAPFPDAHDFLPTLERLGLIESEST